MSLDANDIVENLIDEQARRNALFVDQPDLDAVIQDIVQIPVLPAVETVGMQADSLVTTATGLPHKWDDTPPDNTDWDFFSWDT